MKLLVFIGALSVLASIAYFRARREGDIFKPAILISFALPAVIVIAMLESRTSISTCIVVACVVTSAATDMSSGYVYDDVTFPSLVALIGVSVWSGTLVSTSSWAAGTFALCLSLHAIMRRRGLGLGDVKLFTVVAAGLCSGIGEIFAGSFVIGACIVCVALARRTLFVGDTIAFAPFIAVATLMDVPWRGLAP